MVAEILREGFGLARRRLNLIVVDILWKAIWLMATVVMLVAAALWFGNELGSVEWQGSGVPGVNGLLGAAMIRQVWNEYAGAVGAALIGVVLCSLFLWMTLEAFFRSRILPRVTRNEPRITQITRIDPRFKIYLASNIARSTVLLGTSAVLALIAFGRFLAAPFSEWPDVWLQTRSASVTSLVVFLCIAFFLTIVDTLIRSDALELFGTDLIRVGGVIGILVMFEALVSASVAVVTIAGFLRISSAAEAGAMLGVSIAAVVLVNLFHSYLLLVRFSAIAIMRHNVVEI